MPTLTIRRTFFATLVLVASTGARLDAAAGDLDCTFGIGGRVSANFTSLEMAQDVEVLADGSIVTIASSGTDLRLSRFLANGALDSSFGGTGSILHTFTGFTFGGADFVSSSVRFDRDSAGNYLVVGSAIVTGGDREVWVGRFTPAGAVDTTFGGGDGWVSFDWAAASNGSANALDNAYDIAVDASDRPVVGGTLDLNGPIFNPSDSDIGIARLTTAGVLDTTFSGDGIALVTSGVIDDELRALKIDPSGRIVAVGDRWPISGARDTLIVRLTAVGALDTTFDADGIRIFDLTQTGSTTTSIGDDFAVDLDFAPGSPAPIVVTGYSVNTPTVVRFLDGGAVDTTFGGGDGVVHVEFEVGAQDVLEHVIVQPDGKILVTGWPILAGPNFDFSVMRLETDGDLDPTWAGDGRQTFNMVNVDRAYTAALMPDGRVVLAGSSANDTILVIARLLGDASLITTTTTSITWRRAGPDGTGTELRRRCRGPGDERLGGADRQRHRRRKRRHHLDLPVGSRGRNHLDGVVHPDAQHSRQPQPDRQLPRHLGPVLSQRLGDRAASGDRRATGSFDHDDHQRPARPERRRPDSHRRLHRHVERRLAGGQRHRVRRRRGRELQRDRRRRSVLARPARLGSPHADRHLRRQLVVRHVFGQRDPPGRPGTHDDHPHDRQPGPERRGPVRPRHLHRHFERRNARRQRHRHRQRRRRNLHRHGGRGPVFAHPDEHGRPHAHRRLRRQRHVRDVERHRSRTKSTRRRPRRRSPATPPTRASSARR